MAEGKLPEGKWVSGISPDTPVKAAALQVLAERFAVVRHYLPLAVERSEEDPEHVHQLRVATRRATAAVRAFASVFPRKLAKALRRCLRSLRRAAGDARDWDVFLLALPTWKPLATAAGQPARDLLTGYALGTRAAAQARLVAEAAASGPEFDSLCEQLPRSLTDPPPGSPTDFGHLAVAHVGALLTAFDAAVTANPTDPGELHQLRILGKRARYSLEIFAACLPTDLRTVVYPSVEAVQGVLGELQDAVVGHDRLSGLRDRIRATTADWPRYKPGFDGLMRQLRVEQIKARRAFQKWRAGWIRYRSDLRRGFFPTVSQPVEN